MAGLRFLKLLDGEKATPRLEALVQADASRRKELLAQMLRDAYGEEIIDQLPSMTPNMLSTALDGLGATDATRRKAFSFLVNAAKAIDLPIADALKKKARNKASRAANTRRTSRRGQDSKSGNVHQPSPPTPPSQPAGVYAVVHALVDQLPPDQQWPQAVRDRWLQAVTSNVDWLITQVPDTAGEAADGNKREAPGLHAMAATPGASEGESRDT